MKWLGNGIHKAGYSVFTVMPAYMQVMLVSVQQPLPGNGRGAQLICLLVVMAMLMIMVVFMMVVMRVAVTAMAVFVLRPSRLPRLCQLSELFEPACCL